MAGMAADVFRREEHDGPPPIVISAVFGDLSCDESTYIQAAQKRLPFSRQMIAPLNRASTAGEMLEDIRKHEWPALHRQRPLFDGFIEAARSSSTRLLLNGLGGDELTTDYRYYADHLSRAGALGFLRTARLVNMVEGIPIGRALYLVLRETCPEEIKRPYRWIRRRLRPLFTPSGVKNGEACPAWLNPEAARVAREVGTAAEPAPQGFGSATLEAAWQILTHPYYAWANRWLVTEFAAAGIECRFPFLDRRLFEFVFSIPSRLRPRCRGSPWFKPLIAQGLRDYIPAEIRIRNAKVHFEAYNCRVFDADARELERLLFDSTDWCSENFVTRKSAQGLFDAYLRKANDQEPLQRMKRIAPLRRVAELELWLRERSR